MPPSWRKTQQSDTDALMGELAETIKQMDWPIHRRFSDTTGTFCLRVASPRGQIYITVKAYPYDEKASFPERVVNRARDNMRPVCVFFGDDGLRLGNAYAYNPRIVEDEGTRNLSDESPQKREYYYDIPLSRGVILGGYIAGHDSLPGGPVQSSADGPETGRQRSFQSLDIDDD